MTTVILDQGHVVIVFIIFYCLLYFVHVVVLYSVFIVFSALTLDHLSICFRLLECPVESVLCQCSEVENEASDQCL